MIHRILLGRRYRTARTELRNGTKAFMVQFKQGLFGSWGNLHPFVGKVAAQVYIDSIARNGAFIVPEKPSFLPREDWDNDHL